MMSSINCQVTIRITLAWVRTWIYTFINKSMLKLFDVLSTVINIWLSPRYFYLAKLTLYRRQAVKFVQPVITIYTCDQSECSLINSICVHEPGGCFTNVSRALQKFSRNLCIAQIVLVMRISSWNFVRVPKALLWAHVQIFRLKFSP